MKPALVVGEGIAGQATALALAAAAIPVLLLAREPAEHTESTHRHDGFDAARGADDSPSRHLDDLLAVAGPGSRPFLESMTNGASAQLERLERLEIPFERERDGDLVLSQLKGSSVARSVHAESMTARHLSRRLSALLAKYEVSGQLHRYVGWTVVDLVLDDDGSACGVVAQCFATGELRSFEANGVCLASGGHTGLFMHDTLAPGGLGGVTGLALRRGASVVAPGSVSVHPLCYRAAGFVRRLPRRLESMNADLDAGLFDLTRLDRAPLRRAAGSALEAYAQAAGADPYSEPIVVMAAPDRTLGGLEVSTDHATAVPGLYAVGGVIGAYFGAGTLPGTPLLAALHGSTRVAAAIGGYRDGSREKDLHKSSKAARKRAETALASLLSRNDQGDALHAASQRLRTVVARGELKGTLDDIEERAAKVHLRDRSRAANTELRAWWDFEAALVLARRIAEKEGT